MPPYSYVPGRFPHPVSDARGHSFRNASEPEKGQVRNPGLSINFDPDWKSSPDYLFGIDLFNHGFYWEAHETWERLWIVFGRSGSNADFIKGLIKLAAAGVKAREGRTIGVQRHARRAEELFREVMKMRVKTGGTARVGGMDLTCLCEASGRISENAASIVGLSGNPPATVLPAATVLPVVLWPADIA